LEFRYVSVKVCVPLYNGANRIIGDARPQAWDISPWQDICEWSSQENPLFAVAEYFNCNWIYTLEYAMKVRLIFVYIEFDYAQLHYSGRHKICRIPNIYFLCISICRLLERVFVTSSYLFHAYYPSIHLQSQLTSPHPINNTTTIYLVYHCPSRVGTTSDSLNQ
jgi:hypothetical protein